MSAPHRPFLRWPDRRLATPAAPVAAITDEIRAIWDEMVAAMDAMPGVGLAAPQIGVMLRLAVVDASAARGRAVRLANPVIVSAAPVQARRTEASPNLPGVSAEIARPAAVTVRYLDASGSERMGDFDGLAATSVQHQIDHLDGRMYFDHLGPVKRRMLLSRAAKLQRRG